MHEIKIESGVFVETNKKNGSEKQIAGVTCLKIDKGDPSQNS